MANPTEQESTDYGARSSGPHVLLQDIAEAGAYVCHWSGDLLRVTEHEIPQHNVPESAEAPQDQLLQTTKISGDPFIPISQARFLASNFDIDISF